MSPTALRWTVFSVMLRVSLNSKIPQILSTNFFLSFSLIYLFFLLPINPINAFYVDMWDISKGMQSCIMTSLKNIKCPER